MCSTEESLIHKPYILDMKFSASNDRIIAVKFEYDNYLGRYTTYNNEIGEIEAINEATKEITYVYYLKSESKELINARGSIKTGYYGYSASSGCYIWGTLYEGDNGQSIFVPASGINAALNPPLCGYYYA